MNRLTLAAALAVAIAAPANAQVSYDTAIFAATRDYCNRVAERGGKVVDRDTMIDTAVDFGATLYAASPYRNGLKDRDVFRTRVIQAIDADGCGAGAPSYGGDCVAIINGVRLKECSGRF